MRFISVSKFPIGLTVRYKIRNSIHTWVDFVCVQVTKWSKNKKWRRNALLLFAEEKKTLWKRKWTKREKRESKTEQNGNKCLDEEWRMKNNKNADDFVVKLWHVPCYQHLIFFSFGVTNTNDSIQNNKEKNKITSIYYQVDINVMNQMPNAVLDGFFYVERNKFRIEQQGNIEWMESIVTHTTTIIICTVHWIGIPRQRISHALPFKSKCSISNKMEKLQFPWKLINFRDSN